MAETKDQAIQKCEHQLEGLFIHLASVVYEKAASGAVTIQIDPQEKELQKELEALFFKIHGQLPQSSSVSRSAPSENRRGSLAPYVDINLKLHEAKKRFVNLREDVDGCLSLASLHLGSEERAKTDQFLDRLAKAENTINVLFEKVSGSVRQVMGMKKESMDKNISCADAGISKDEKKFLTQSEAQIHDMARGVETLVEEAKTLFESIKAFYERDAAQRLDGQQGGSAAPSGSSGTAAAAVEVEEEIAEDKAFGGPAMVSEEGPDEEKDVSSEQGPVAEANDRDLETQEATSSQGVFDESVLHAAERKLLSDHADEKEQFHVLMTLFRSMDTGVMVDFLARFLENAPVITKVKVLDLVTKVEHPGLEKVYERFLSSPESLLRFKGIVGYGKLRPETSNSLMLRAAGDPEASIRRLAANCLRPEEGHAAFITVVKLADDRDDQVARVAIRKLATHKTLSSFSYLLPKLRHANPKIRKEASEALKTMTGKDFGYRAQAPERERERAAKLWEKFLVKNQARPQSWEGVKE